MSAPSPNPRNVTVTLPDGSTRTFTGPVTAATVAADIGPGLARVAYLAEIDGEPADLATPIGQDSRLRLLKRDDDDALWHLRHDCAHVLAEAVKSLYPDAQVTIGPPIDNGFYYDFYRETPFTLDDLARIESRMHEIVDADAPFEREVWDRDAAIRHFEQTGETFKAEIIQDLPETESIRIYRQGASFLDLCRGPHGPSTGRVGHAFKLMKLAGAYWRGDHRNPQLQRIYGTAWASEKDLAAHLHQLEEAERRDHRRLGREMDLFHFEDTGPGVVFWHPKGTVMFRALIDYMRKRNEDAGYVEVATPQVLDRSLWETSGHWEKFGEHMFTTQTPDDRVFALKPMNCPGAILIYNQGIKSYRDLPLRLAEFGQVHRYEPSGALHGLMRVRAFMQDDAHVFLTDEQITQECVALTRLLLDIYRDFGFEDVRIKFADRPEKRVGEDAVWDKAEEALKAALDASGQDYAYNPGEGAFYGPKLEFVLRDAIGRDWQCGTIQVDLNLPGRLGATYVGEDGAKHVPVMIHRALFGSLERFIGILVEHYAGRLPLWLSPVQAVVATITSEADGYAEEVTAALRAAGLRVQLDLRNEKINYKIREHSHAKVPTIVVVGRRESEDRTVALRHLGGKQQEVLALEQAVNRLRESARTPIEARRVG